VSIDTTKDKEKVAHWLKHHDQSCDKCIQGMRIYYRSRNQEGKSISA
jgi:hypothetical protein